MISSNILNILNRQVNKELYSAYLYLSMSNYFSKIGLCGFANWLISQAEEEKQHAMDFYNHIKLRNSNVELYEIDNPPEKWNSPKHAFQEALEHEKLVTNSIHNIMKNANSEEDFATASFLDKYIQEQIEEEKTFSDIIAKIEMLGDDKMALIMLDNEYNGRE